MLVPKGDFGVERFWGCRCGKAGKNAADGVIFPQFLPLSNKFPACGGFQQSPLQLPLCVFHCFPRKRGERAKTYQEKSTVFQPFSRRSKAKNIKQYIAKNTFEHFPQPLLLLRPYYSSFSSFLSFARAGRKRIWGAWTCKTLIRALCACAFFKGSWGQDFRRACEPPIILCLYRQEKSGLTVRSYHGRASGRGARLLSHFLLTP